MISRRRLLIAAAATGCTGLVPREQLAEWRGKALGARASISVVGQGPMARNALRAARDTVMRIERYFSLFDVNSTLTELNATGRITMPPEFIRLVDLTQEVYIDTGGLFDPTIQPLFRLYSNSRTSPSSSELKQLSRSIGWDKVTRVGRRLELTEPGMALTFNGIAQGFATDRVCEVLSAHGYD
ncbi:MAG: FAD:protein FMN transferase, partial [Hyphomicrobiaceae bacterium]